MTHPALLAAVLLAHLAPDLAAAPPVVDAAKLAQSCRDKDKVPVELDEVRRAVSAALADKALAREHEEESAAIRCRPGSLHLALTIAWGDCPSGCIHGQTHYFTYDRRSRRLAKAGSYGDGSRDIPLWGLPQAYAAESFADVPAVHALAKDPDWGRREYAVWFLSEMLADAGQRHRTEHFKRLRLAILSRSKESLELLCGALADADADVAAAARGGLAKAAGGEVGASPEDCLARFKARDWRTIAHKRIPEEEDEEIAELIKIVIEGSSVAGLTQSSARLEAIGKRAVGALMKAFAETGNSSIVSVLCGLGPAAAHAVPDLVTQLTAAEPARRIDAAKILSFVGPKAKAALPSLDRLAAKDSDPDARKMADRAVRAIRGLPPHPPPPKRVSPRRSAE